MDPTLGSSFMQPVPEEGEDQSEGVENCEQYFYDLQVASPLGLCKKGGMEGGRGVHSQEQVLV